MYLLLDKLLTIPVEKYTLAYLRLYRIKNKIIKYQSRLFLSNYLVQPLHFSPKNTKTHD